MSHFFSFLSQHPIIAAVCAAASIFLIIKIARAAFRLALAAVIIATILITFFGYTPKQLISQGSQYASLTASYVNDTIKPVFYDGLKNAHVINRPNGTIEIIGDQFEIGETPQGKFVFNIKPLHLSLSQDELSQYIGQNEMQKLLQSLQKIKQSSNSNHS